ncbi:hypothetical protein CEW83_06210 [Parazoarcus communis]|uniref:DUF4394 domain-containing protein n=1 Tax=Parazoarcus communis TaxID=41977 RepID=A0A2U8GMG9_9RHOO|nr:DUF4394 domain-containing protein [Parazoarcus communis]AWI74861.1 hypothetical protein CEW83_06210 [Parazoarcus communis]
MQIIRSSAIAFAFASGFSLSQAAPLSPDGPLSTMTLHAVTASHDLISFKAKTPSTVTTRVKLTGLAKDERLLGIDYRVARGVLFALGSSGRIFTVDIGNGALTPVGETPFAIALDGHRFGFDFNPAADRIRIVSDTGQNLRAHPDTGAIVDYKADEPGVQADGRLTYDEGDPNAGKAPRIVAAAYTYNTKNEKLTTNYAIDMATATLARQGSIEAEEPMVSPNTGRLKTVGKLGVDGITDAHFDISDISNTAVAALSTVAAPGYRLYSVDLATGTTHLLGDIGAGEPLLGLAIEP